MAIPIMLNVIDKKVWVVGGGNIGYRKTLQMLEHGAQVTCLSPEHIASFDNLEGCSLIKDIYKTDYLKDQDLILVTTNDESVNKQIHEDCKEKGLWCYRADDHEASDLQFMMNKVMDQLVVAVTTQGQSPRFSKELLERLIGNISQEDLETLTQMGIERQKALKKN